MANIFINGLNAKTGGGKSILNNYLTLLKNSQSKEKYFILTPNKKQYQKYKCAFIEIVYIKEVYKKTTLLPFVNSFILPKTIKSLSIELIFNLADIPIPTATPQVFLFDWPYAAYPESTVWGTMDVKSSLIRRSKLYFFKKYLHYPKIVIAQTETMKKRLESIYELKNIEVVPNAVSLENMDEGEEHNFHLPSGKKLLYLTYYYPHKNLEIFIPLAKEIRQKGLEYKLITTIDASQHSGAKQFLEDIKKYDLGNIIINIGPVDMKNVPSLYKQCDGLLMPTLLESFSGTYVEAMYHQIPIFTSDIDFATGVCEDAAFYFDPFDEKSILETINTAFENDKIREEKVNAGKKVLSNLLSWEEAFSKYQSIIKKALQEREGEH